MRYINRDVLMGDVAVRALIAAAEAAREEILGETDRASVSKLIEKHRDKWTVFRTAFKSLSHDKCWYTECVNPGTDDDIDHFRPKGRLADDDTHGGYWWEALNWKNFRLSCHRANRLRENPESGNTHGKGDHFPLASEETRCRAPGEDLGRERPLLLDPTDPLDPPLLTFEIDGTVSLSADFAADPEAARRIDSSRIYLHLEWPEIKEQRQQLYTSIHVKIHDGEGHEERARRGEVAGREGLKAVARDLIEMTKEDKPHSRAARAFISHFRHIPWVNRVVLPQCA